MVFEEKSGKKSIWVAGKRHVLKRVQGIFMGKMVMGCDRGVAFIFVIFCLFWERMVRRGVCYWQLYCQMPILEHHKQVNFVVTQGSD